MKVDSHDRAGKKLKSLGKVKKKTKGYIGFSRENWSGGWRWGEEW